MLKIAVAAMISSCRRIQYGIDLHEARFLDPGFLRGDESFFNTLLTARTRRKTRESNHDSRNFGTAKDTKAAKESIIRTKLPRARRKHAKGGMQEALSGFPASIDFGLDAQVDADERGSECQLAVELLRHPIGALRRSDPVVISRSHLALFLNGLPYFHE